MKMNQELLSLQENRIQKVIVSRATNDGGDCGPKKSVASECIMFPLIFTLLPFSFRHSLDSIAH